MSSGSGPPLPRPGLSHGEEAHRNGSSARWVSGYLTSRPRYVSPAHCLFPRAPAVGGERCRPVPAVREPGRPERAPLRAARVLPPWARRTGPRARGCLPALREAAGRDSQGFGSSPATRAPLRPPGLPWVPRGDRTSASSSSAGSRALSLAGRMGARERPEGDQAGLGRRRRVRAPKTDGGRHLRASGRDAGRGHGRGRAAAPGTWARPSAQMLTGPRGLPDGPASALRVSGLPAQGRLCPPPRPAHGDRENQLRGRDRGERRGSGARRRRRSCWEGGCGCPELEPRPQPLAPPPARSWRKKDIETTVGQGLPINYPSGKNTLRQYHLMAESLSFY